MFSRTRTNRHAFTLIELLIVVTIIGILAAIAVPNFMNAQVRAKLSACYSDMRALGTAIEMYRLDNTGHPPYPVLPEGGPNWLYRQVRLSTPIAYIGSIPVDPFFIGYGNNTNVSGHDYEGVFDYVARNDFWGGGLYWGLEPGAIAENAAYHVHSPGPDLVSADTPWTGETVYAGSNGLKSAGDVFYVEFQPAR